MLRFFLDEHISLDVALALRAKSNRIDVHWTDEWDDGALKGKRDDEVLRKLKKRGVTLVTYDLKTIPPLLKIWAEIERDHAGVILVDDKTLPPNEIGGLIKALLQLWEEQRSLDWTNRIVYLKR